MYSIYAMIDRVDELIIVTNKRCFKEICALTIQYHKIKILINDIDCRFESLNTALSSLKEREMKINNIIVHDAARPFITKDHINELLLSCNTFLYSQYYLKLVNGLYKKTSPGEMVDRDQYIEICTPLAANFKLFDFIFSNYIHKPVRITYEHISILDLLKIKYNLIMGSHKHLRKITYIDDVDY
jgi:2-C-methyl-D-erythritol 4-phosphate cytidylyltransferase